ncbi:SMI1/KNR4 family protein [Actinomadura kijaniata]|uniref:SMI1/KNR4 family protein n=1 Tax=Actinomadura kijaniata TaxID=46161 RepID=UPI000834E443|nr:SMI1/KNR4 family protein [Actinomadura kijaniata]
MTIDWIRVRERVAALAASPHAAGVFGGHSHRFELEPVLTPDELAEAEAQFGVTLPEDYRGFLLHAGRGGAGPSHGIFPLRRGKDGWRWEGDGADLASLTRLREPFPVRGPDPAALDALLAERPEEEDFEDVDAFDVAYEAWDERLAELLWNEDRTVGAVCLCHHGCAAREWLVVSGPERGTVWSDDRVDEVDLRPRGERTTFGRWYLEWLAEAEEQVRASAR